MPDESKFIDDGVSGATLVWPALERLRDTAYSGVLDRIYNHRIGSRVSMRIKFF